MSDAPQPYGPGPFGRRSVGLSIAAGIAVGVLGAIVWAVITNAIDARIGYLALGVGAAVGFAMGRLGSGPISGPLPILAGVISLLSIVVGDTFGWAAAAAGDAGEAGLDLSSTSLVKALVTGDLEVDGVSTGVDVRGLYRDDVSVFLVIMLLLGVYAAFSLCRNQLAQAGAAAPPAPSAPAYPPPAPGDGRPSLEKRPDA